VVRSGLCLVLLGIAACAHTGSQGGSTPKTPPEAPLPGTVPQPIVAQVAPPLPLLPKVFVPAGVGATTYGGPLPATEASSHVVERLRRAIIKRSGAAGFAEPRSDRRLDLVAADLANTPAAVSHELVNFLSHHYGLAEPQPNLLSVGTDAPDDEAVNLVMKQAETVLLKSAWPRLGLAAVRKGQYLQVIVLLGMIDITFDAFPRTLKAKNVAQLQGVLPKGFGKAQLVVTTPAGTTGRLPVSMQGQSFTGTFSCMAGSGRYDVELMAEASRGPEVMLNAPVFCDLPAPTEFLLNSDDEFRNATTPADVESAMVAAINRERAKRRLPPLAVDERLHNVARSYAADMAQLERVAHVSPDGQSAVDRVRQAGLSPTMLAENVGSATVASAVHAGFMSSPGHRGNVLEPLASHMGVGVAQVKSADGPTVWYVTELFARFSPLQPAPQPRTKQR